MHKEPSNKGKMTEKRKLWQGFTDYSQITRFFSNNAMRSPTPWKRPYARKSAHQWREWSHWRRLIHCQVLSADIMNCLDSALQQPQGQDPYKGCISLLRTIDRGRNWSWRDNVLSTRGYTFNQGHAGLSLPFLQRPSNILLGLLKSYLGIIF